MTLEEKAEEYCNHLQSEMLAYTPENPRQQRTVSLLDVEEAYLAGAKEALKMKVNITTISDAPLMEREWLGQAKEFLEKFCSYYMYDCDATRKDYDTFEELKKQAEQFLKEIENG